MIKQTKYSTWITGEIMKIIEEMQTKRNVDTKKYIELEGH